jgi:hypothetical protein
MSFSRFAPYLIAYLFGVATPVLMALFFFRGQDNERENSCFLVWLLVILVVAIIVVAYFWAAAGV